jgi:hypothetical protein
MQNYSIAICRPLKGSCSLQLYNGTLELELEAVADFLIWDWKLTACHFFSVDRSLFTGVL